MCLRISKKKSLNKQNMILPFLNLLDKIYVLHLQTYKKKPHIIRSSYTENADQCEFVQIFLQYKQKHLQRQAQLATVHMHNTVYGITQNKHNHTKILSLLLTLHLNPCSFPHSHSSILTPFSVLSSSLPL